LIWKLKTYQIGKISKINKILSAYFDYE